MIIIIIIIWPEELLLACLPPHPGGQKNLDTDIYSNDFNNNIPLPPGRLLACANDNKHFNQSNLSSVS